MIVIRGKAADAIREARCTGCWPEGINEGILFIPETLELPTEEEEDDGGIDYFVAELIEIMKKPVTGDGKWFPRVADNE